MSVVPNTADCACLALLAPIETINKQDSKKIKELKKIKHHVIYETPE